MTILSKVHVLTDVGNDRWGGCNSALNLTIASGGIDVFNGTWTGANTLGNGHTVPANRTGAALVPQDTAHRRDLARKRNPGSLPDPQRGDPWIPVSYYIFEDENPYDVAIDTTSLEPSSVRLSNTGADLVRPRHIVVWGMAALRAANWPSDPAETQTPVPLAAAIDFDVTLSNNFAEGQLSVLVPRTAPWLRFDPAAPERRVDRIFLTIGLGANNYAATPEPVSFRVVGAGGQLFCSQVLAEFDALRPKEWKSWVFSVTTPFTWGDIMPSWRDTTSCRLRVEGGNRLQIAYVYAFGIDSTTAPIALLPLVHLENPDPDAWWIGGDEDTREKLLPTANHDISEAQR